jgi:hypothetical protein
MSFVASDGLDMPSRIASVFARSSNLPRTRSRLVPERCEGVHRLVAVCVPDDPVLVGDWKALLDAELDLERVEVVLRWDDVRSSSLV